MVSKVKVKCKYCGNDIQKIKAEYERRLKKKAVGFFCNLKCSGSFFNAKHLEKYKGNYSHLKGYENNRLDEYSPFKYSLNKAKSRSRERKEETDLTLEYLKEIYDKQNGLCPYTNIKMEIPRSSQDEDIKKSPTKLSLDRIDPNLGYIKGNVEFVCYCINVMKNDFTKEKTLEFIKKIKIN